MTPPKKISDKPPTNIGTPVVVFETAVRLSSAHGSGATAVFSPKQGASLVVATSIVAAPTTTIPSPAYRWAGVQPSDSETARISARARFMPAHSNRRAPLFFHVFGCSR
jgi:hypothetical protein